MSLFNTIKNYIELNKGNVDKIIKEIAKLSIKDLDNLLDQLSSVEQQLTQSIHFSGNKLDNHIKRKPELRTSQTTAEVVTSAYAGHELVQKASFSFGGPMSPLGAALVSAYGLYYRKDKQCQEPCEKTEQQDQFFHREQTDKSMLGRLNNIRAYILSHQQYLVYDRELRKVPRAINVSMARAR